MEDEDELDEQSNQIQDDIADYLADLSNESDTPTEFDQTASPFLPADVDFDSEGWMVCVSAVQGWLRFDSALPMDDRGAFAAALADALGFTSVDEAFEEAGNLKLLPVALDRLRARAERAALLQRAFADEFLSEGGTRESATRVWLNGWDEDDETEEPVSPEPVSAKADTYRISDFVAQAQSRKLNLAPSYQRGDVWRTGSRQLLIESILRGIPLPSVILLKPSDGANKPYEVVDGKQRLTSILRFVGKHPLALERVQQADAEHPGEGLAKLFAEDYPKFKRAWKGLGYEPITSTLEEQYYFPFKLRTDDRGLPGEQLAPLRGKYYTQIKALPISVADQTASVEEVFEGYSEYKVPIIVYSRASQRQIHEVFNLYNKQGTHLNAEEIRNAIYHDLQITRATLVAAGDSDSQTPVVDIAPALVDGWPLIETLRDTLSGYGFGDSRYRRTKILSWIIATLLVEARGDRLPSTAKYIDSLLTRVRENKQDPLRDDSTIRDLFEWIAGAAEAHAATPEAWAPRFRDGENGTKWQELQLVGTLVGVTTAYAVLGDELFDRLSEAAPALRDVSESKLWERPAKTQTKTQWEYISRIAQGVVLGLHVDADEASAKIKQRFGSSGIKSLWAIADYDLVG